MKVIYCIFVGAFTLAATIAIDAVAAVLLTPIKDMLE